MVEDIGKIALGGGVGALLTWMVNKLWSRSEKQADKELADAEAEKKAAQQKADEERKEAQRKIDELRDQRIADAERATAQSLQRIENLVTAQTTQMQVVIADLSTVRTVATNAAATSAAFDSRLTGFSEDMKKRVKALEDAEVARQAVEQERRARAVEDAAMQQALKPRKAAKQ